MINNTDRDFLIPASAMDEINGLIKSLRHKPIMLDQIVRRALYRVYQNGLSEQTQSRWLRIMDGDLDCNGEPHCTVTYKDKRKDMTKEDFASLDVDNFEDALHLFDLLHFTKTSYQENLRSKFICEMDGIQYLVRFDIWPQIEDVVFVAVSAKSAAEQEDFEGFVEFLKFPYYNIEIHNKVDVDSVYRSRFNKSATNIARITFDFGLEYSEDDSISD